MPADREEDERCLQSARQGAKDELRLARLRGSVGGWAVDGRTNVIERAGAKATRNELPLRLGTNLEC